MATTRFVIVPKVGTGTFTDPEQPKYVMSLGLPWAAVDYGLDATMLVAIAGATGQQIAELASNIDAVVIPANLDTSIGLGGLAPVQAALEGLRVPAGWVTTTHTYRHVIAFVAKLFLFQQRFSGAMGYTLFRAGATLDTRINQLSAKQRSDLQSVARAAGLDTSAITGPMTLRQALKTLVDQMPVVVLGGESF